MVTLYILTDPRPDTPFAYIGATSAPLVQRLQEHLSDWRGNPRNPKAKWIRNLIGCGLRPIVTKLDDVPLERASQAEQDAIEMCRAIRGIFCLNKNARRYQTNIQKMGLRAAR